MLLRDVLDLATDSERRRQVNPRKVYPVDTGLMALFAGSGKANVGHALETAVLQELQRLAADHRNQPAQGRYTCARDTASPGTRLAVKR